MATISGDKGSDNFTNASGCGTIPPVGVTEEAVGGFLLVFFLDSLDSLGFLFFVLSVKLIHLCGFLKLVIYGLASYCRCPTFKPFCWCASLSY